MLRRHLTFQRSYKKLLHVNMTQTKHPAFLAKRGAANERSTAHIKLHKLLLSYIAVLRFSESGQTLRAPFRVSNDYTESNTNVQVSSNNLALHLAVLQDFTVFQFKAMPCNRLMFTIMFHVCSLHSLQH